MKQYNSCLWLYENKNDELWFYRLILSDKVLWKEQAMIGKSNILFDAPIERQVDRKEYVTEEEAWASFELLKVQTGNIEGQAHTNSPIIKKLLTKQIPPPENDIKHPVDPEELNLCLIKRKRVNNLLREYQEDVSSRQRRFGKVPEKYREALQRFYEFLFEQNKD